VNSIQDGPHCQGLLANQPLLDSIRNALNSGPDANETIVFLIGVAAFFMLIVIAARCFARDHRHLHDRRVNYLTLAVDLLGLSELDRHDLETIARLAGLEQPAAIMLSPANLARALATTSAAPQYDRLRKRAEQLCLRLFNSPLPALEAKPHRRPG